MTTFNTAFERVIGHEGVLSLDRNDRGNWTSGIVGTGELKGTKYGISAMSYPYLDIANLTLDDSKAIYQRDFWNRVQGDDLMDGVAFQLFDFAVNSGPETAIRRYQKALRVADDGHFGPISKHASLTVSETDQIMRLNGERLDFMTNVSTWQQHGRGWARRIANNLRYGAEDS